MNLAIRGIEADFGPEHADTFRRDLHKDLKADFVLANPPFNNSDLDVRTVRANRDAVYHLSNDRFGASVPPFSESHRPILFVQHRNDSLDMIGWNLHRLIAQILRHVIARHKPTATASNVAFCNVFILGIIAELRPERSITFLHTGSPPA
jgi:hypothetical protein